MKARNGNPIWSVFITSSLILLAATVLFGLLLYRQIRQMTLTQIRTNALDVAGIAAIMVDAEAFARLKPGDEATEAYRLIHGELTRVLENCDVEYLYTIRREENGEVVFVVDSDPQEPGAIGEPYTGSEALLKALDGEKAVEDEPYTDRWGVHISAYAPVFLDGETVGAAVVDLPYGWVQHEIRKIALLVGSLCSAFFIMSFLLLLFVARQTERNAMRLRQAKERAEESERTKTRFFARVSHEIRTPINAMLGMNEIILRESRAKNPDAETLRRIERSAEQAEGAGEELRALMEEMLDFARLEKDAAGEGNGKDEQRETETNLPAEHDKNETEDRKEVPDAFIAPEARILVVDDIELNISVVAGLLQETRIAIDAAMSGEAALVCTADTRYDLILMDQRMPGLSGTQTLHAIRAQEDGKNRETPVICVTGDIYEGAREQYFASGFDGYLAKPLQGKAFRSVVAAALPQEKVIPVEETKADENGEASALSGLYAKVPQLDYKTAKLCLGTDTLVEKTLRQFTELIAFNADEIARMLAEEDYEGYTIRVHALKSSARTVGALGLSDICVRLEACGNVVRGERDNG